MVDASHRCLNLGPIDLGVTAFTGPRAAQLLPASRVPSTEGPAAVLTPASLVGAPSSSGAASSSGAGTFDRGAGGSRHSKSDNTKMKKVVFRCIQLSFAGHTDRYDRDLEYRESCICRGTPRTLLLSDGSDADIVFKDGPARR